MENSTQKNQHHKRVLLGTLDPFSGIGVLLRFMFRTKKCLKIPTLLETTLHFRSLFRTNDKIHTLSFDTILKSFRDQQTPLIQECLMLYKP